MNGQLLLGGVVFMPMVAAGVSYLIGRKEKHLRDKFVVAVSMAELLLTLILFGISGTDGRFALNIPGICGMGLHFTVDGFRVIYGTIAAFMWMTTAVFSPEYFAHYRNRNRYYLFFLLTLGATEAVFFSADLFSTSIRKTKGSTAKR